MWKRIRRASEALEADWLIPICFTDIPGQKRSNGNTNGFLKENFLEKTNFSGATYRDLYWKSVYRINNRVGKVPGEKTAQECFDEELRSSAWDVDFGMKIHQTRDKVAMQKIDKTDTLKTILNGRKYTVDYFQREYRWGRKQIEQMLADF